ncbi:DUF721 domain-containing protein [Candidatus Dependentiae bacterium]|nr:DUF721 domain-containing protein [Candidatus Dependentiae bacterium]
MKHIKTFLHTISTSKDKKNWKMHLIQQWGSIVGTISYKVSIYKIYNNSIILGVSDSSWMHELYLLSNVLKQKINMALDQPRIESVQFRYVSHSSLTKISQSLEKVAVVNERDLTVREKKALEKINDGELAQALERLLQKCLH